MAGTESVCGAHPTRLLSCWACPVLRAQFMVHLAAQSEQSASSAKKTGGIAPGTQTMPPLAYGALGIRGITKAGLALTLLPFVCMLCL